jgi:hypothetical protein
MTDEELKAIDERASKATPGPWTRGMAQDGESYPDGSGCAGDFYETGDIETAGESPQDICFSAQAADATFIAHARTDIPALLATLRSERAAHAAWKHAAERDARVAVEWKERAEKAEAMSEKNEAPALPGEVWRGQVGRTMAVCMVDGSPIVRRWLGEAWGACSTPEVEAALTAWALSLSVNLSAALREADRLRHGQDVEGDHVCPNEMRADRAEKLAAAERALRKVWQDMAKDHGAIWTGAADAAEAALIEAGGTP